MQQRLRKQSNRLARARPVRAAAEGASDGEDSSDEDGEIDKLHALMVIVISNDSFSCSISEQSTSKRPYFVCFSKGKQCERFLCDLPTLNNNFAF